MSMKEQEGAKNGKKYQGAVGKNILTKLKSLS